MSIWGLRQYLYFCASKASKLSTSDYFFGISWSSSRWGWSNHFGVYIHPCNNRAPHIYTKTPPPKWPLWTYALRWPLPCALSYALCFALCLMLCLMPSGPCFMPYASGGPGVMLWGGPCRMLCLMPYDPCLVPYASGGGWIYTSERCCWNETDLVACNRGLKH